RVEGKPQIDLNVEMNAQGRADGLFEVDLKLSVKAASPDATLFQVELVYGGLFQLAGVAEKDVEPMLLVECPRYLFPFARQIISACTADGGFYPPFQLDPLDFAAIYMARKQNGGAAAAPAGQAGRDPTSPPAPAGGESTATDPSASPSGRRRGAPAPPRWSAPPAGPVAARS